ncbi:MAG: elongation factor P [Proteobacteria bacterium]|nr:elongation factor P [Pseudomonadota bacterium]
MYQTTDFTKGLKVEYRDEVWTIVECQHVSPGKGSAFVKTKLKSLQSGRVLELNFKAGVDKLDVPDVETHSMQYLYHDGDSYHFMNEKTYDQIKLSKEEIQDAHYYLQENSVVKVVFYKGKAVSVDVDNFVELPVQETQPNIKGDTSSGGGKPATLSTGLTVVVPFHVIEGDVIRIDTRSNKYMEKVK